MLCECVLGGGGNHNNSLANLERSKFNQSTLDHARILTYRCVDPVKLTKGHIK